MAWDDKLPKNIHQEWQSIKCDIVNINNIEIPRWLGYDDTCRLELHGFCDASQKAYGCVIYIKVKKQNEVDIKLIVGKSRLVPCKKEVSLPRLELCGALLLSEVMIKIKQALSPDVDITDGQILWRFLDGCKEILIGGSLSSQTESEKLLKSCRQIAGTTSSLQKILPTAPAAA
ncbi:uncharacterized protein LOC142985930 [Anticarsia gemmatalis]|uniref:uncharacterized protein LOC142985929 n=1 Tax=Anticarsia gemmatalis TaxID=129554 RepID=UPI003F7611A2